MTHTTRPVANDSFENSEWSAWYRRTEPTAVAPAITTGRNALGE